MPNDDAKLDPDITVTDELDPADVAVITDGLRAHDLRQTGYYDFRPLAVFVRDRQTGKVVGGLHGRSEFGLVYVAWFFLPEDLRRARIGSRVLAMAEEEGRRRGCTRIALPTLTQLRRFDPPFCDLRRASDEQQGCAAGPDVENRL